MSDIYMYVHWSEGGVRVAAEYRRRGKMLLFLYVTNKYVCCLEPLCHP